MTEAWHVARCWIADAPKVVTELALPTHTAFWPRWVERRSTRGRIVEVIHPLMSGYIFVRFDAQDMSAWRRLHEGALSLWLHGFIGGWPPTVVADEQLQPFIEMAVTPDGMLLLPEAAAPAPMFRPGEIVLLRGPFATAAGGGIEGRVSWADVRGARIITVMFGRAVETYAPNGMIEKLERASPDFLTAEGAHKFRKKARNRAERLRRKSTP